MLSVHRLTVPGHETDQLAGFLRDDLPGRLRAHGGLIAAYVGRSRPFPAEGEGDADRAPSFVVVGRWSGYSALRACVGRDSDRPTFLGPWQSRVRESAHRHYEALELEPPSPSTDAPTILRLSHGEVDERDSTTYYEFIRSTAWPTVRVEAGVLAAEFGRCDIGGAHAVVLVTAWRSLTDLLAVATDPSKPVAPSPLARNRHIELFDVVTALPSG